jgi:type I restriction enzyme, S subunit
MNAERLLLHYERIAEAPDAIARLRRLVLDLALRGKLVRQDPRDLPASKVLTNLGSREIEPDSPPHPLPMGWSWTVLGAIARLTMGQSPPGSTYNNLREGMPLINGPVEFSPGPFGLTVVNQYTTAPTNVCEAGDLLVCVRGSTTGRTNVASARACIGRGVAAIRPHSDTGFVRLFIWKSREMIIGMGRGIAFPSVSRKQLEELVIAFPPLEEQRRIVAKVDEMMRLCDQLEAARNTREAARDRLAAASLARLNAPNPETFPADARFALDALPAITTRPDQIKQLRQTILNLAVRGKLVPQDSNDESASELLKRFTKAKAERKKETGDARIKAAPDPTPDELNMPLPSGWAVQSFENLFLFIDYRGNTPPKTDSGVPLITAKNIRMGHLNREPREYISKATFKSWMTRGFPEIGDLFFTTEAPLANICLNDIEEPFALAQRAICFQPYDKIDTRFLMFAIMSDVMQSLIDKHATGMTAKGIKAAKLKPLPIPIPPLAEQRRIVARVDELLALCDRLEASLTASADSRRRLLDALLSEALVPSAAIRLEAAE